MKENFLDQLEEMTFRIEQQKIFYEQVLKDKENEMMISLHEKISEFTQFNKNSENKLYEELQLVDDKLKAAEKSLKQIQEELNSKEKIFYKEKKSLNKELENLSNKNRELMVFKEKFHDLEEQIKKNSDENHEELKKKVEKISILEQNKVNLKFLNFEYY